MEYITAEVFFYLVFISGVAFGWLLRAVLAWLICKLEAKDDEILYSWSNVNKTLGDKDK